MVTVRRRWIPWSDNLSRWVYPIVTNNRPGSIALVLETRPLRSLNVKAVILAGGLGSRLSEETSLRPKPMVEIGGRPILWHIMKTYEHFGLEDFVLCLGYKGHVIKEYFINYELRANDFEISLG